MSGGRARAGAGEYAQRVNAAVGLLEAGVPVSEVVALLAARFGCSVRHARRYAERAELVGRTAVPEETTVFTVKLPAVLVGRVRDRAKASGSTISALVAQALTRVLARALESALAGERAGGRDRVRLRPPRGHGCVSGLLHSGATAAGSHRAGRSGRTTAA